MTSQSQLMRYISISLLVVGIVVIILALVWPGCWGNEGPTVSSLTIDEIRRPVDQLESARVCGLLVCSNNVPLSDLRIVVYVRGIRPTQETKWRRSSVPCVDRVSNHWALSPDCTTFPRQYSDFSLIAVLVAEDNEANLPQELPANDEHELRAILSDYRYACDDHEPCNSVSPVVQRNRSSFIAYVPVEIETPFAAADASTATPTYTPPPSPTPTSTLIPSPTPLPYVARVDLVGHRTTRDQDTVRPGTTFTDSWALKSSSLGRWPEGTKLVFVDGDQMGGPDEHPIELPLTSTETFTVNISLVAPASNGNYAGTWQIRDAEGNPISEPLLVSVLVYQAAPLPTSYPPPALAGLNIIQCTVTFHWGWPGALAEDEYFAVRFGIGDPGHSRVWTKETLYSAIFTQPGEYIWEVAICRGDPDTHICEQLAVSKQGAFEFRGCGSKK